ncbi:peptidase S15 [Salinisphaera dokdonensis CL-ES53]|uniref:Peptidase S15 n=1 Tax=Salinisphaera dokdonensis CL-ES53 TaxID=1304272 RepID=A0ABV2B5X3_9GAMM
MATIQFGRVTRAILVMMCLTLALAGCNDDSDVVLGGTQAGQNGGGSGGSASGGGTPPTDSGTPDDDSSEPTVPVSESRAGTVYRQALEVDSTGDTIVIQLMEPSELVEGESYPLVLHGHGYGGSRSVEPDAFQQQLRDAGYYVLSIDERGFGESSGTVRVMSPDFEGQDLIAVLDWAEDLEGLARRANGKMKVGSYGGSYGGMYQWLLAGADPEERLRVLAPDIAPFDLTYSLNPNNVVKTGWVLALVGAGELPILGLATTGDPTALVDDALEQFQRAEGLRQDPVIYESVVRGALTNNLPDPASNLFRYHSLRYFCETTPAASQAGFTLGVPDPLAVAPGGLHELDALITQGFRDTLFNFNDAANSYDCLKQLGGDVRLLTHQTGHVLPVSLGAVGLEEPLDPFYAALTLPGFQDAGGSQTCGSLDLYAVTFAWFEEKLRGQTGAIDNALTIGDDVCLSLDEGDAIAVDTITFGGESHDLTMDTPALSGVLGLLGATLGSEGRERLLQTQSIYTAPMGGAVLAGVPKLSVTIEPTALLEDVLPLPRIALLDPDACVAALPLNCDPVYFFALGKRAPNSERWDLIDDQLTPLRGFGTHDLDMTGVAERLSAGDEVGVLIYGFHPQYPISFSRDLFVPASTINGNVEIPILDPQEIAREGV